jgi:hypothetical protein
MEEEESMTWGNGVGALGDTRKKKDSASPSQRMHMLLPAAMAICLPLFVIIDCFLLLVKRCRLCSLPFGKCIGFGKSANANIRRGKKRKRAYLESNQQERASSSRHGNGGTAPGEEWQCDFHGVFSVFGVRALLHCQK